MTPHQMVMTAKRAGSARLGELPYGTDADRVGGPEIRHGAIAGIVGHVDSTAVTTCEDASWAWTVAGVAGLASTRPACPPCAEAITSPIWQE